MGTPKGKRRDFLPEPAAKPLLDATQLERLEILLLADQVFIGDTY